MKYLIIVFFINSSLLQILEAQDLNGLSSHKMSVDFGSYRNRYLFPITNIRYSSPVFINNKLNVSARLRSYGTLYFFTKIAYDFTPQVEYYFTDVNKVIYFTAGIGIDGRIRLLHDERSDAKSSAEPLVSITTHVNFKKLKIDFPIWSRFYSNGIAVTILPELSYQIGKKFAIYTRFEWSQLSIYGAKTHEGRIDSFIGVTKSF